MKHKIIGIAGNARVGKDTAADCIIRSFPQFNKASFADPIKKMLMIGLGMTAEQMYGDDIREQVDIRYDCTPRHLMQTLGTEWGRNIISQNIWVNAMKTHINETSECVVIPDVRFESEADMIREEGILIHIFGEDKLKSSHSSETGIYFKEGDLQVRNDGSLYEYYLKLEKLVHKKLI